MGLVLIAGLFVVHEYPYAIVRPGSDYDVAMKNLILQGFGYSAIPGLASLLAAVATLLMPKKGTATTPVSNLTTGADNGQR